MKCISTAALVLLAGSMVMGRAAIAVPPNLIYDNNLPNIVSKGGARYTPQKPTVSPYMALAQNTGSLAFVNYFTITRPLILQQQVNAQQGTALQSVSQQLKADEQMRDPITGQPIIRPTGHHAGFMTQDRYFLDPSAAGGVNTGIRPR